MWPEEDTVPHNMLRPLVPCGERAVGAVASLAVR